MASCRGREAMTFRGGIQQKQQRGIDQAFRRRFEGKCGRQAFGSFVNEHLQLLRTPGGDGYDSRRARGCRFGKVLSHLFRACDHGAYAGIVELATLFPHSAVFIAPEFDGFEIIREDLEHFVVFGGQRQRAFVCKNEAEPQGMAQRIVLGTRPFFGKVAE
jgi:hypothetical protein